jgi:FkbM family methyltransferase
LIPRAGTFRMSMTDFRQLREACVSAAKMPEMPLDSGRPVWVFGAGGFGRDVSTALKKKGFDVAGFVETKPRASECLGLPVRSWAELGADDKRAQLVVGIFNRDTPLDGLHALAEQAGCKDIFLPYDYFSGIADQMGWRFWLDSRATIIDALPEIEAIYNRLADDISRRCMLDTLLFRLGANLGYAGFMHQEDQYFCDLTLPGLQGRKITYVDAGAYDGDTYLKISKHADLGNAFLFEPDRFNFQKLVSNVRGRSGVVCLPCGMSDRYAVLSFNAGVGESGQITNTGTEHIVTVALDDLLPNQKVDMIKVDIEGAEAFALKGSARTIEAWHPILALSLYHNASDIWKLPELVNSLYSGYKFYIRQHHFNTFESVLYAVPG